MVVMIIALYESIKLIQNYEIFECKKIKSIHLYEKIKKYLSLNDKNYEIMKQFIQLVCKICENNIEKIYEECGDYIDTYMIKYPNRYWNSTNSL